MRHHLRVLLVLALTQIAGWGMIGILPVIAPKVVAEFGSSLPTVFLGTSVMFVAMGLAAPWAGRAFRRFGTHQVMAAGAGLIGLGLFLLALSPNLLVFWSAWALIGLAGAMFLTTAAYAYIAEYAEEGARSLIGTLMLVTGLAGSVFWPITAFLEHLAGWRGVGFTYAAVMVLAICPLVWLGLPATKAATETAAATGHLRKGRVFVLMVAAIALNSFVTFGIDAVGIQLLQALGMDLAGAVAIASLLGSFQGRRACGRSSGRQPMGWTVDRARRRRDDPDGTVCDVVRRRRQRGHGRLSGAVRVGQRRLRRGAGHDAAGLLPESRLRGGDGDHSPCP